MSVYQPIKSIIAYQLKSCFINIHFLGTGGFVKVATLRVDYVIVFYGQTNVCVLNARMRDLTLKNLKF